MKTQKIAVYRSNRLLWNIEQTIIERKRVTQKSKWKKKETRKRKLISHIIKSNKVLKFTETTRSTVKKDHVYFGLLNIIIFRTDGEKSAKRKNKKGKKINKKINQYRVRPLRRKGTIQSGIISLVLSWRTLFCVLYRNQITFILIWSMLSRGWD